MITQSYLLTFAPFFTDYDKIMHITIRDTLILCATFLSLTLFAQQTTQIKGRVYNKKNNQPISDVAIYIGAKGTTTDNQGCYVLTGVRNKLTRINVSCIGFQAIQKRVDLTKANTFTFDFYLQEIDNPLEEVVVTGTRTEKTLRNTPVLTKLITETDIREMGSVTAFDALQSIIPGIQFTPDVHGANIIVQGLDNDYILVLIDGERMVGETRGNVNFDRISASDIKQIEVVSGASSVLYGSNAIGGVINIITKDVKKTLEGKLHTRHSKFNTWNSTVHAGIKTEKVTVKANAFRHSSDGYSLTNEASKKFTANPYVDYSIGTKLSITPTEKLNISLHGKFFRHENANPKESPRSTHKMHKNYSFGSKLKYDFSKKHNISLSVNSDKYNAYTVYEKFNDSTFKNSDYQYTAFLLTDSYRFSDKINLVAGAEWNIERFFSNILFGKDIPIADKKKRTNDFNLFVQADWKVLKNVALLGGVRYTHHSIFGNHFTPKLSAMYTLRHFKFRGTTAFGYKSPSLKELFYDFDHQGMFWIFGNKDLKPEDARYFSLSGEYTKGKFNFSVNAFHNEIENKIDMIRTVNNVTNKVELHHYNVNKARIRGVESYLNWHFLKHLKWKAGYVFSDAVDKSTGLQVYGNSKHTATTALTFFTYHTRYPFSVTFSSRIASPRLYRVLKKDTSGKETQVTEKSDAYSISRLTYTQRIPFAKSIVAEMQLGITNIFDYSDLKNFAVIDPGRAFWGGLSVIF